MPRCIVMRVQATGRARLGVVAQDPELRLLHDDHRRDAGIARHGPRLVGEYGSPEFIASYNAAAATKVPTPDGRLLALGTDGFGRSETRTALRRFFEIDAESIAVAALYALAERKELDRALVKQAIKDLGVNPDQPAPWTV